VVLTLHRRLRVQEKEVYDGVHPTGDVYQALEMVWGWEMASLMQVQVYEDVCKCCTR
jgi:hypothetical protein